MALRVIRDCVVLSVCGEREMHVHILQKSVAGFLLYLHVCPSALLASLQVKGDLWARVDFFPDGVVLLQLNIF